MKKLMKMKTKAFTLVEMLVVLLVISVLLLLFVPNLSKQKEAVHEKGNAAVVKVVEGQAELYELQHNDTASVAKLVAEGMISEDQAAAYNEYFAKNTDKPSAVNP
ncbi:competence type IV pilus major pilin ComGC [Streptococcus sp. ZJ93]|uniref:competence type IV pilus major pilin ComGC n=1 Tax=Streptococcus handemini TaxID=3161188 RepID=UPI0032ED57C0